MGKKVFFLTAVAGERSFLILPVLSLFMVSQAGQRAAFYFLLAQVI